MNPVIGLFNYENEMSQSIGRLKEAGFVDDKIRVINQENTIRELLGCKPSCSVIKYAAWGSSIGIVIYIIFGLVAGWCQCNLLGFGQVYGFGTLVGAIMVGGFIGGFLGSLVGVADFEENSHLYIQGTRMGGKVVLVETDGEDTERVKLILEQNHAMGVKAL